MVKRARLEAGRLGQAEYLLRALCGAARRLRARCGVVGPGVCTACLPRLQIDAWCAAALTSCCSCARTYGAAEIGDRLHTWVGGWERSCSKANGNAHGASVCDCMRAMYHFGNNSRRSWNTVV